MKPRTINNTEWSKYLEGQSGPEFWRSLDELAGTEEFQHYLHREFPEEASVWRNDLSRRSFLKMMGASLALAGLASCTPRPREKIIPYVNAPENVVPGKPLFFASAVVQAGYGTGVLVESHMGRPTKIEGNPQHPISLGATGAIEQAEVLNLYDPDRSKRLLREGSSRSWPEFIRELRDELLARGEQQGEGLRILTGRITSPTMLAQIERILAQYPRAQWHQWEPVHDDNAVEGSILAFGESVAPQYDLSNAKVILSLDSDFLGSGPAWLKHARDFADARRVTADHASMNRLYAIESSPAITGAVADHRAVIRPSQLEQHARSLAAKIGLPIEAPETGHTKLLETIARDLREHRGECVVIPGAFAPPAVHALAHAMNDFLGNVESTIHYTRPANPNQEPMTTSLARLVEDMRADAVQTLIILDCNPAYTAPADFNFAEAMQKVPFITHASLYYDETARLARWHVPLTHVLEEWSDVRAADGTATIVQPLIEPLYDCYSSHAILQAIENPLLIPDAYELVKSTWRENGTYDGMFELFWRNAVHDGVIPGTALQPINVRLNPAFLQNKISEPSDRGYEIIFRPDPSIYDGRYANNGWLQELPKPLTQLTWDNAALMSAQTAHKLGVERDQVVRLTINEQTVEAPVWIEPGHPDRAVTVYLGYGRDNLGNVANKAGFDAYKLRTSRDSWSAQGLAVEPTRKTRKLACTQNHHSMEDRHLVAHGSFDDFRRDPAALAHEHHGAEEVGLYPDYPEDQNEWGMVIDLNTCIGCKACVIACQAENNIPVVGKQQVLVSREMHWIRVDRYYRGDVRHPEVYFQPVPCMHCEKAPCELVCPVAATTHSDEGLNEMTYNRCVGTRYCSNNCPYKVRRFNFFEYTEFKHPAPAAQMNPDVTVRDRGVMEKCTYCVQRINHARIEAKKEHRPIRDGEVVPACQQVCPTRTIVFGNLSDPDSKVRFLREQPQNYALLASLNTKPRTTYLPKLHNFHEELHPLIHKEEKSTKTSR